MSQHTQNILMTDIGLKTKQIKDIVEKYDEYQKA